MTNFQKKQVKDIVFFKRQSRAFFNTYGSRKLLGSAVFEHLCSFFKTGKQVETFFLHPKEVTPLHRKAAENIISRGMGIYANVPLIHGVNDTVPIMTKLAHQLRYAGIEFHFMVTGGLAVQANSNQTPALHKDRIIDMASDIRRSCSGREIPLYGIQTEKGIRPTELY